MRRMIDAVSQQYDEAYYKAQALLDEYNPCQMVVHGPGKLTCVARSEPGPLCCPDCGHHSDTGCTVMCLGCKVHLCYSVNGHDELRDKLWAIQQGLPSHMLLGIRRSKEAAMEEIRRHIRQTLLRTPERRIAWNALDAPGM